MWNKPDNRGVVTAARIQRSGTIIAALVGLIAIVFTNGDWFGKFFDSAPKSKHPLNSTQKKNETNLDAVTIETLTLPNELTKPKSVNFEDSKVDVLSVTVTSQEIVQDQIIDETIENSRRSELQNPINDSKRELVDATKDKECWARLKSRTGTSNTVQYYDSPNEGLESKLYDFTDGKHHKVVKYLRNREIDWYQITNLPNNATSWVRALNISLDSKDKCNFLK